MNSSLLDLLISLPAVVIAIVLHEWAHGYVSYLLGDSTAKREGRLSLNPLNHIDPMGFLCLLVFKVGWAKPVQINPYMYKNRKLGVALTALAGPLMNFIIAFIFMILFGFCIKFNISSYLLLTFFVSAASINVGLGVFNLIPIPPLDGSKILSVILPDSLHIKLMEYERYGFIILFLFIFFGFTSFINPLIQFILDGMFNIVIVILRIGIFAL